MKRFWVFKFNPGEPMGGFGDFHSSHDKAVDAGLAALPCVGYEVVQIVDSLKNQVVFYGDPAKSAEYVSA
jgi:hypothetical protein